MLRASSWEALLERARRKHPLDQVAALTHAAVNVERALTAVGIPIQDRKGNLLSLRQRLSQARFAYPAKWPPENDLHAAVWARNVVAHDFPPEEWKSSRTGKRYSSEDYVSLFFEAWKVLRGSFVTKQHAADLAARLLHLPPIAQWVDPSGADDSEPDPLAEGNVEAIHLFGSLARGNREPGDIDLLIIDRGALSSLIDLYDDDAAERGRDLLIDILDNRNFFTAAERAAAACGWLDIVALNGKSFEHSLGYRRHIFNWHADPLFFLNIAPDLLIYSEENHQWQPARPGLFEQLAHIRQYLNKVGVPSGSRRSEV